MVIKNDLWRYWIMALIGIELYKFVMRYVYCYNEMYL